MLIGELARRAGVTKDCIRYYESLGLLQSTAKAAGSREYRYYDEDCLERLLLIAKGKAMGFTLREGKPFLDLFMENNLPAEDIRVLISQKMREIDARITKLQEMRKALSAKMASLET